MALAQPNWDDPALRAQVKVGTIFLSDDGDRFVAREIVPEGVIVRQIHNPRVLFTWSHLTATQCILDGEVDLTTHIGPGVTERSRTGILPATRQLSEAEWRALTTEPRDVSQALDAGVAAEILRLSTGPWPLDYVLTVRIDATAPEPIAITLSQGGQLNLTAPGDDRLQMAVYFCYRAAVERQPVPWHTMTFSLRFTGENYRYEVAFGYHWDT
jgi:hypothetical protein